MKIGNVTLPGKVFLAPMAGVTDQAFRELCVHFGASYVITEMVSLDSISLLLKVMTGQESRIWLMNVLDVHSDIQKN